jgi:squalene-hopene/tetraprenyl-beta-curcumene cyclase
MIERQRLLAAYEQARRDLLAERAAEGHWIGELSCSALSTATAVSALLLVAKHAPDDPRAETCRQFAARGLQWLLQHQNADGGWGDTDKSLSNIATTMLVRAAIHLAGEARLQAELLTRAEEYIEAQGELVGLRNRYGQDKTFAEPILTNCALAGLVPWSAVSPLPFEVACLPYPLLRLMRLPVVSYAVPALVAIGQAKFFHHAPRNPLVWLVRRLAVRRSLRTLARMQPGSGGFLEAVPLTSFVVMSLAATRRAGHPVVRRGVSFLLDSVRPDGSWPIDTNLATWVTTLSINALAAATGNVGALGCLDWLLSCQHQQLHPFTHAAPGGWGWSDLSGAAPDVDDTSGALLALDVLRQSSGEAVQERIRASAAAGVKWLLDIQNDDGGWPTFCRGWGALPFDRSGSDLTAHALRALHAWRESIQEPRTASAIERGLAYLAVQQQADGSWIPLWFGNQTQSQEENPVYGTGRVLLAYRDLGRIGDEPARRGLAYLAGDCPHFRPGENRTVPLPSQGDSPVLADTKTGTVPIEETSIALEALLSDGADPSLQTAIGAGLGRLVEAVEAGRHRETAPVGLYFAKLWYYERLYPLTFLVAALGQAVRAETPPAPNAPGKPGG